LDYTGLIIRTKSGFRLAGRSKGPQGKNTSNSVIPAEAGLSTAELVIHLALHYEGRNPRSPWIPAFAGMKSFFYMTLFLTGER
jgi:hypothetical protein